MSDTPNENCVYQTCFPPFDWLNFVRQFRFLLIFLAKNLTAIRSREGNNPRKVEKSLGENGE